MNDIFSKLFDYETFLEASTESFAFEEITMKKDFGPLKKGLKYSSIWFNLEESLVTVFAEDGTTEIHRFEFELTAK